ncbi:MAG: hypothetical protein JW889_15060 [Verrucomicrobia bacterium]|nr:hypothetical protein [Verrucomicrobiota bacterium]
MITYDEARRIAQEHLAGMPWACPDDEFIILDEHTIDRDFGWVFFYDSARHLQTQAMEDSLGGNAPVIVTRANGAVHDTGTAHAVEFYIANFEKYGTPHPRDDPGRV